MFLKKRESLIVYSSGECGSLNHCARYVFRALSTVTFYRFLGGAARAPHASSHAALES